MPSVLSHIKYHPTPDVATEKVILPFNTKGYGTVLGIYMTKVAEDHYFKELRKEVCLDLISQ